MIVPMKKISLITMGDKKTKTLKTLRKLGIVHIEISEGASEKIDQLREQTVSLENALFTLGKTKKVTQKEADFAESLKLATQICALTEEKKKCQTTLISLNVELELLKEWGEIDPNGIHELIAKGV